MGDGVMGRVEDASLQGHVQDGTAGLCYCQDQLKMSQVPRKVQKDGGPEPLLAAFPI